MDPPVRHREVVLIEVLFGLLDVDVAGVPAAAKQIADERDRATACEHDERSGGVTRHRDHLRRRTALGEVVVIAHRDVRREWLEVVRDHRPQDEPREEARRIQRAVIAGGRARDIALTRDDLDPVLLELSRVAGVVGVDMRDDGTLDVGELDADLAELLFENIEFIRRAGIDEDRMRSVQHVHVRQSERDRADRRGGRRCRHRDVGRWRARRDQGERASAHEPAARIARGPRRRRCVARASRCDECRSAT